MKTSSIGQSLIILVISFLFGFGYNTINDNGLSLIAVKNIVGSEEISDIDSMLSETTFLTAPMMIDLDLTKQFFDRGVFFVDARDENEYREEHIVGAFYGSVVQLASQISSNDPVVIYCSGEGCIESMEMAENLMLDWNFTKVFVFEGGWPEWKVAKYPVEGI